MTKPQLNKKAFKYAIWSSMSRVLSVALGASAGAFLHQWIGSDVSNWGMIALMSLVSYALMFFAEYKKENNEG